jgi:hypothetical protein
MCGRCENPSDSEAEEDIDGLRECVREHGWVIKCVEDNRRPYAYTVGLHQFGLPELLATGVTTERALVLLDHFAREAIAEGAPKPGDRLDLFGLARIEAILVDHPDAHLDLAVRLFGPKLRAMQLVWTDMQGHWPWNKQFDFDGLRQPVLGIRSRRAQKA